MAPLSLEVYNTGEKRWVQLSYVNPGDRIGSISSNKPDGSRELYLFECSPDDSKSLIYRSESGLDIEIERGVLREALTTGLEVVKELRRGDEPYMLLIKTDKSPEFRQVRFAHK